MKILDKKNNYMYQGISMGESQECVSNVQVDNIETVPIQGTD